MPSSLLRIAGAVAGTACAGAGYYLLTSHTADPTSYLQTIGHGLGGYMIGKGIFVWAVTWHYADRADMPPELPSAPPGK